MVFTTPIFLYLFLPGVLTLYHLSPRRAKTLVLTLSSFLFYGWWRPDFVLLMVASAVVDYLAGGLVARSSRGGVRRAMVVVSCVVNLGLLAYFKYANFGVDTINELLVAAGHEPWRWTKVVLPVGISFYTFQSMSYTIDVYRGEAEPVRDPLKFLCYVSLFPQLVAGPIVRYREVADQLLGRRHTIGKVSTGALLFQVGFCKKVLIADSVAPLADGAFALANPTTAEAWLGILSYAFQIYFDFSGYSDMAIGLGLLFGFVFPINFDSPYKSQSITEFWRRWHISLSSWLRDYLYIPLGGNRRGPALTYVFLMTTMLLGGLWHGAAWTFVAWGAYQGLWLVVERLAGKRPLYHRLPAPLRVGCTFVLALGGWVFFRAEGLGQAFEMLAAMAGLGGEGGSLVLNRLDRDAMATAGLIAAAALAWGFGPSQQKVVRPSWIFVVFVTSCFGLAVAHLFFQSYRPFLYFQF